MKRKTKIPVVFFNASVIIAGLLSSRGGSAKLLSWIKDKKIIGIINETTLDEVLRHQNELNLPENCKSTIEKLLLIIPPPDQSAINKYKKLTTDEGDLHILVSSKETNCDFLVSLDKKHILILKNKIKDFSIVNPAEIIEQLSP